MVVVAGGDAAHGAGEGRHAANTGPGPSTSQLSQQHLLDSGVRGLSQLSGQSVKPGQVNSKLQ